MSTPKLNTKAHACFTGILQDCTQKNIIMHLNLENHMPYITDLFVGGKKCEGNIDGHFITISNVIYKYSIKEQGTEILIIGKESGYFLCCSPRRFFLMTNKQSA